MLFFLPSCIKEDLTDCPPSKQALQVVFSYENDKVRSDAITQDELKKATLFIFDENEEYVTSVLLDNPQLNTVYEPDITLMPGKYNFVVWFNLFSPYSYTSIFDPASGDTLSQSEMEFYLDIPQNRQIVEPAFSLPLSLYGYKEDLIKVTAINTVTIPVKQNTNVINITVHGLAPTADNYRFTIKDDNCNYNFNGDIISGNDFEYTNVASFPAESDVLSASLTVLKLSGSHPHAELTIDRIGGEQIFPNRPEVLNNLIQMILAAYPENDFDRTHIYDIDISYGINMSVSIKVNGWNVTETGVEIIP
jgi:hypothetical protein